MRRSFGGNGVWRMSFSGFSGICEVSATSGFGASANYVGPCGYPACCILERFRGRRCADRKKHCIVSLDVLVLSFHADLWARIGDPSAGILQPFKTRRCARCVSRAIVRVDVVLVCFGKLEIRDPYGGNDVSQWRS